MDYILLIGIGIGCLLLGGFIVFLINRYILDARAKAIVDEATKEAEVIKKNKFKNNIETIWKADKQMNSDLLS